MHWNFSSFSTDLNCIHAGCTAQLPTLLNEWNVLNRLQYLKADMQELDSGNFLWEDLTQIATLTSWEYCSTLNVFPPDIYYITQLKKRTYVLHTCIWRKSQSIDPTSSKSNDCKSLRSPSNWSNRLRFQKTIILFTCRTVRPASFARESFSPSEG